MVQVANFLLRWLFLCRLVDDRAEVQTWPYRRPGYYEHTHPPHQPHSEQHAHAQHHLQHQQEHQHDQHTPSSPPLLHDQDSAHPKSHHPPNINGYTDENDSKMDIPTYRESVIRSLTSYPPGSFERLQRLEELRLQSVREFANRLVHADEVIRWSALGGQRQLTSDGAENENMQHEDDEIHIIDKTIKKDFQNFIRQQHSSLHGISHDGIRQSNTWKRWQFPSGYHDDGNIHGTTTDEGSDSLVSEPHNPLKGLTREQAETVLASAHKLLEEAREFLPQLVSTVLHSPPSLLPENVAPDPISSLRSLLIHRCQTNPSLGIELCWLLEAEVGRKWKALFEHRQQTGKRLILIVQADIAAAIATIGAEKASAFNLLQDAEMATAFGMERRYEDVMGHNGSQGMSYYHQHPQQQQIFSGSSTATSYRPPPRSISDLRCRHFGDSMHFVDQLTQISLDLRHVPPVHRQSHLQLRLFELNRRLCRRMATRGRISIDVEDSMESNHYGPAAVPQWSEENIREDMIRHSVQFPMEPQCVCWPGGLSSAYINMKSLQKSGNPVISDTENPQKRNGVVRALRILPNNCRILASAHRCPFLVRMEVVETGLHANDARLYAIDVPCGIGVTIQEALGSIRSHRDSAFGDHRVTADCGFAPCEIPPELMMERQHRCKKISNDASSQRVDDARNDFESPRSKNADSGLNAYVIPPPPPCTGCTNSENRAVLSRGGYQDGVNGYDILHDTFDMVREHYYDDLHHTLRQQRENEFYSSHQSMMPTSGLNQRSTGSALLDKVFGKPWNEECEHIRQQSPYRNVKGWKLASFIIKAGEDIRKEALVMQIMSKLWTWFQEEIPPHLRPFLRPYTIMCTGGDAGIVECLPDVKSVNEVKKETDGFTTLLNFFERAYGPPVQPRFRPDYHQQTTPSSQGTISIDKARDNFLRSLVGYSVVCYVLQIKDRHNANILLDRDGHIMHIDFGFVLGETPKMGKVPLFSERAPFKLSADFWEVIGGWRSFKRFCEMFEAAYAVAAAHSDEICSLIESAIMNVSRNTDLARAIANGVRGRIQMKSDPKEQKLHIMNIVNDAITSWGTSTYDWLQRSMHGYQ